MPTLDLGLLIRKLQDDVIGVTLDLARISPMDDRQFKQYEKLIKKQFREIVDSNLAVIKEYKEFTVSDKQEYLDAKVKE